MSLHPYLRLQDIIMHFGTAGIHIIGLKRIPIFGRNRPTNMSSHQYLNCSLLDTKFLNDDEAGTKRIEDWIC